MNFSLSVYVSCSCPSLDPLLQKAFGFDRSHSSGVRPKRYHEVGFDKLADMPRPGRPAKVAKADMKKIRKNACGKTVWTGREMQEYIRQRTGVRYNLPHVRYILRSWGYSQKVPVGRHARRAPDEEIRKFQKAMPDIIKKRTVKEQS